jgi:TIR domain
LAFVKKYQYDLFISYAHADNSADAADKSWVLQFKKLLQAELSQRLGGTDELKIFFDTGSPINQQLDNFTNAARNSAIFLAVASPSYAAREWTAKELDAFTSTRPKLERFFAIECLPLAEGKSYPVPLQNQLKVKFWDYDSSSSTAMRLSPVYNAEDFKSLIYWLADQIQRQLDFLAGQQPPVITEITTLSVKTFVPNFTHDLLISCAFEDENWTKALAEHLHKQLKQELGTADGFKVTLVTELSDTDKRQRF